MNKANKIITHHAVSSKKHTAYDVNQWHYDRWNGYSPSRRPDYPFVGYHYIIEWSGKIVQCRDHNEEGIHCKGQNFSSIGVCFMGNFSEHMPSKAQEKAWLKLYSRLGTHLPVHPHRTYANKECHGKLLSDTYWTDLVGKDQKTELQEQVVQLLNRLYTLLLQRRIK